MRSAAAEDSRDAPRGSASSRVSRSLIHDVFLQGADEGQQFVLFGLRYFEFVERLNQVLRRRVPIIAGDSQTVVRGLHVATGVEARAASGSAKLIDHVHANLFQRILAVADKELGEFLVGDQ